MRFLKNKIARAEAYLTQKQRLEEGQLPESSSNSISESPSKQESSPKIQLRTNRKKPGRRNERLEEWRETKNIAKNFGKAICNFSLSLIAMPYLQPFLKEEGIELSDFTDYINKTKNKIDGLMTFRSALIHRDGDTREVRGSKIVFKKIGEVFVKYFSVNWIFHGKVVHKKAHLKFRFKMLRRIQQPEQFTYLRRYSKPRSSSMIKE